MLCLSECSFRRGLPASFIMLLCLDSFNPRVVSLSCMDSFDPRRFTFISCSSFRVQSSSRAVFIVTHIATFLQQFGIFPLAQQLPVQRLHSTAHSPAA